MFQEIYVIDEKEELVNELKEMFKEQENLKFKRITEDEIQLVFRNLPQLIIINDDNTKIDTIDLRQ